ncbi:MAG: glycosyltransferase family 39 protein [Candidatus Omnitrophota bacterium]
MLKKKRANLVPLILIFVIILIFSYRNAISAKTFFGLFGHDAETHHAANVMIQNHLATIFAGQNLGGVLWEIIYSLNHIIHRPPLYFFSAVTTDLFVGNLLLTELYILPLIFFVVTIIFTFKTGEYLCPGSGIIAALFLSILPGIVLHAEGLTLYAGQIALTITAFYYLLRSEYFSRRKFSIAFGIVFGLGVLMKEQFFLFFIGPAVVIIFMFIKKIKSVNVKNISYGGIAFLLSGVLLFTAHQAGFYLCEAFMPGGHNFIRELTHYLIGLKICFSLPILCLWIYVCIRMLARKETFAVLIGSSLLFCLVFFSLFDVRGKWFHWFYLAPALPQAAVMLGVYSKKYKDNIYAILLILTLAAYPFFTEVNAKSRKTYPQIGEIATENIVNYIATLDALKNQNSRIGIFRDSWEMVLAERLSRDLKTRGYAQTIGGAGFPDPEIYSAVPDFDVFILVSKNKNSAWPLKDSLVRQYGLLLPELKSENGRSQINRLAELEAKMCPLARFAGYVSYEGELEYITVFINKKSAEYPRFIISKIINIFKIARVKKYEWY